MPRLKEGQDCCGCTACASVCPKDAICMVADTMGFKYPIVDYDRCIECGLCEKTCSFTPDYKTPDNFSEPIPFGVRIKDAKVLMDSRSGGAFTAFSDWILEKGGIVYGCGYEGHFIVTHKRATTAEGRDAFRGSKYVQSELDGIFRAVRDDLRQGKWVLFSGTPCQTSGLASYLSDSLKQRLLMVDIVCHGVPSPKIWKDYLAYVEDKTGMETIAIDFRDKKRFGWKAHKETLTLRMPSGVDEHTYSSDAYTYLFYRHIMLRPSCAHCRYCNLRRPSDLTLADFWGWEKTGSKINEDDRGLSLVLVNTPKGQHVFSETRKLFESFSPRLADCMQGHLKHSTSFSPLYDEFRQDYERRGFGYVLKKYGNVGWRHKLSAFADKCWGKMVRMIGK